MNWRPSNLPMLAKCARFVGKPSEHTESGTLRHKALELYMKGDKENQLLMSMEDDQRDGVIWAAQYIERIAPISLHPMTYEQPGTFLFDDFSEYTGHMDAECGPHIFDLKWRRRDYQAQFAAYALIKFQKEDFETVTVHALFAERQRFEVYEFTQAEALEIVETTRAKAQDETLPPTPCEYCSWCANRVRCEAFTRHVAKVVAGYSDGVTQWHPSAMEDAGEIATGWKLWREIVKPWGESMEHHALEAMLKRGLKLPGLDIAPTKPREVCNDMAGAYNALGLPQELFLKAAAGIRLKTSAKYPDRVGAANLFKEQNGMKLAPALREVKKRLEPFMDKGKAGVKIIRTDAEETEPTETDSAEEGEK